MRSVTGASRTGQLTKGHCARPYGRASLEPLAESERDEALAFLMARPLHTFGLVSYILENGVDSPHNRGKFYRLRDCEGKLEGLILIGHHTLFEARSAGAVDAMASFAKDSSDVYMVLGEQEKVARFWSVFSSGRPEPSARYRELLMSKRWPGLLHEPVPGLRLATPEDLEMVVASHVRMGIVERGLGVAQEELHGFRSRCARRIERKKTWVWIERGRLNFKAEVLTITPHISYIEGVWVDEQSRGQGYGSRCMSHLSRLLLERTRSVCLLVNEANKAALALYQKTGFNPVSSYETIYV